MSDDRVTDSTMTEIPCSNDPERIWLSPECCADPREGRLWCENKVWPEDDCDTEPTEYVRADKAAAMLKTAVEALEGAKQTLLHVNAESGYCCCGDPVDSHTIGSGHSPVDADQYAVQQTVERIDNTIASLKQPGGR